MQPEQEQAPASTWHELHPFLSESASSEPESDSIDESIRYALDEIRIA